MNDEIETALREAITRKPQLARDCRSVSIELHPDALVLDGVVATIGAKRRLALLAAQNGGGLGVLDRVRVETPVHRDDTAIRDSAIDSLLNDPLFEDFRVVALDSDATTTTDHRMDDAAEAPVLGVAVDAETVRLLGSVPSLVHRRLAEVLVWWTPGTVDVDNLLYVEPSQEDSDDRITHAVRMTLDRDPRLDSDSLEVGTHARTVRLHGVQPSPALRHMAECDAWYVRGVHEVVNDIDVGIRASRPPG